MRGLSLLLGAGVVGALAIAFTQASGHAEPYQEPPPPLGAKATEQEPGGDLDESDPSGGADDLPSGIGRKNPHAMGATAAMGASGHPTPAPSANVAVGKIDKAKGPNARRVAEVFAQKKSLEGKPVRIRGVVVKSMAGVLGKTFLHLRDGSGEESKSNHDLTVTTDAEPKVGDTIPIEGSVVTDKDFGAGYRYDVIVEQARVIPD
jgi:hypothetical protein